MTSIYNIKKVYNLLNQVAGYSINVDGDNTATFQRTQITWDFPDTDNIHIVFTVDEVVTEYTSGIGFFKVEGGIYYNTADLDAALKRMFPIVAVDGVTITGSGTPDDPFVSVGGSGGGGSQPAQMILETKNNVLYYYFLPGDMSFLTKNPELFLFRQCKQYGLRGATHPVKRGQHWVHSTHGDGSTKWNGWKFFCGDSVTPRNTEFDIAVDLEPFVRQPLTGFNKSIFRRSNEGFDIVSDNTHTVNDFLTGGVMLTGSNYRKGKWAPSMVLKFMLCLAIDNPTATKENGQCPKLFIQFSEPFYTFPSFSGNGSDGSGWANITIGKDAQKSKLRFVHG